FYKQPATRADCGKPFGFEDGGAKRDRTVDLLHAMQALSQLSYSPISRTGRMLRAHPASVNIIFTNKPIFYTDRTTTYPIPAGLYKTDRRHTAIRRCWPAAFPTLCFLSSTHHRAAQWPDAGGSGSG